MKCYQLCIFSNDTADIYNAITLLLGVTPMETAGYGVWTYSISVNYDEPYFDFINVFLDLLEPKLDELAKLGILRENIILWLLYKYEH